MDFSTSNNPNGPSARIRRLRPPTSFDVFGRERQQQRPRARERRRNPGRIARHQGLSRFDAQSAQRVLFQVRYDGKHLNSPTI
jgi:hypothetical protein